MGSKNHITILLYHAYYYDIPTTSRHAEHIVTCRGGIGITDGCGLGGVCDHRIITSKEKYGSVGMGGYSFGRILHTHIHVPTHSILYLVYSSYQSI